MGCGSPYAVIYFLSYHVALSMMLLMMLVAVVLDAYKEAYQREVSAVSDILLNQILELWSEFDLRAVSVLLIGISGFLRLKLRKCAGWARLN